MKKNSFFLFSLILFVGAVGIFYVFFLKPDELNAPIQTFEQCVAAGYPTIETYPSQCKTSDGKTFTENIGNEMQMMDKIKISSPRPNQYLTSPVMITGEARGTWFFEAVAPVKLVDEAGHVIAQGQIRAMPITNTPAPTPKVKKIVKNASGSAEATWMTTEFVPFSGELTFKNPPTPKATLIIEKDNPSGLPEKAEQLSIPVYLK